MIKRGLGVPYKYMYQVILILRQMGFCFWTQNLSLKFNYYAVKIGVNLIFKRLGNFLSIKWFTDRTPSRLGARVFEQRFVPILNLVPFTPQHIYCCLKRIFYKEINFSFPIVSSVIS